MQCYNLVMVTSPPLTVHTVFLLHMVSGKIALLRAMRYAHAPPFYKQPSDQTTEAQRQINICRVS